MTLASPARPSPPPRRKNGSHVHFLFRFLGPGIAAFDLDHISCGVFFTAMTAAHMIERLGPPLAKQKDQKSTAQRATGFRDRHRVKHGSPVHFISIAGYLRLPLRCGKV